MSADFTVHRINACQADKVDERARIRARAGARAPATLGTAGSASFREAKTTRPCNILEDFANHNVNVDLNG